MADLLIQPENWNTSFKQVSMAMRAQEGTDSEHVTPDLYIHSENQGAENANTLGQYQLTGMRCFWKPATFNVKFKQVIKKKIFNNTRDIKWHTSDQNCFAQH